jgi:hypothetical protein
MHPAGHFIFAASRRHSLPCVIAVSLFGGVMLRAIVTAGALLVTGVNIATPASAQTSGTYKSTLDQRQYELRVQGNELVIYTAKKQIAAVLKRKSPADQFKGETTSDMVASPCPQNIGKIETVDVMGDRIRMRLETPQKNTQGRMACKMLVVYGSAWKPFEMISEAGAPAALPAAKAGQIVAPATPPAEAPQGVTDKLEQDKTEFHVESAAATSADELSIEITALNQGDDRFLTVGARPNNYGWCHIFKNGPGIQLTVADGEGGATTQYDNPRITIGEKPVGQMKFNTGDKVRIALGFKGLKSSGGVLKAQDVRRLDVALAVGDAKAPTCGVLTFRNIPIKPLKWRVARLCDRSGIFPAAVRTRD